MDTVKALLVKEVGKLEFADLPKPRIGDYEVLFKTKCTSLCTVDRRVYLGLRKRGKMPFLGGHECSGYVVEIGRGVVDFKPGDHVIFTSGYCGQCDMCRSGRGTQCRYKSIMPQRAELDGTMLGGGLCEYLRIPASQLIKYPDEVDMRHACLTEPLACCIHSVRKANIELGETVVIIGMGIMGYFHLRLANMKGARVIVSETDPVRAEKALKNGAWRVIDPTKEDVVEAIRSLTNGEGANVVVNTIPAAGVWGQAIDMLAPYGRLIAYSSQDSKEPIGVNFDTIHGKETQIIGTLNPNIEDNYTAVKLISYGLINMDEVIDGVYPFEDGIAGFEEAIKPGAYRVIIEFKD